METGTVHQTEDNSLNKKRNMFSLITTFIVLYIFWIFNSGVFDAFHLSLGVICSFIVAYVFHDFFIPPESTPASAFRTFFRFLMYLPWLLYQIALSNWDVMKRAIHPDMPINPQIIKFSSTLKGDLARTTFANSITLTPGTITVDIDPDGTFYVHAIADEPASSLLQGPPCEMASRSGYIYGESKKWGS
jgi:multicomponent Na+:H+ antiporter subunit E